MAIMKGKCPNHAFNEGKNVLIICLMKGKYLNHVSNERENILIFCQSYNLLFEKFLLVNFTRSIWMSDEFRVMNSLDDLIHVRIDHRKLFAGNVLVDATRLQ